MYTTRWGEPIARILMAYPTPQLQVQAIEKLIGTVEDYARSRAKDQIAQSVCEGMHAGIGTGLKCRSCWEAEMAAASGEIGIMPGANIQGAGGWGAQQEDPPSESVFSEEEILTGEIVEEGD